MEHSRNDFPGIFVSGHLQYRLLSKVVCDQFRRNRNKISWYFYRTANSVIGFLSGDREDGSSGWAIIHQRDKRDTLIGYSSYSPEKPLIWNGWKIKRREKEKAGTEIKTDENDAAFIVAGKAFCSMPHIIYRRFWRKKGIIMSLRKLNAQFFHCFGNERD